MVRRRLVGTVGFAGATAGSAVLGWLGKRRALRGIDPDAEPAWAELQHPVHGRPTTVRGFDRTRLHVEVLGPEDAPTIVLIHGYGLNQHAWHYQRRDLADGFRLVCYDQRGHGASAQAASGDYRMSALGQDLAAVLDATVAPGQPVVVAGHSLGAMTVLSFVGQFPEQVPHRFAGASLISTASANLVAGGMASAGIAALRALASHRSTSEADLAFLLMRSVGLSPDADPAHVAFTEQMLLETPGRVRAALGPALTSLNLSEAAEYLTVPTLVMVGEHDRLTPVSQARRLAEALPDAELVELPGAGHMAPLEAHPAVTGRLRALAERTVVAPGGP